jgi:hypothetical protein
LPASTASNEGTSEARPAKPTVPGKTAEIGPEADRTIFGHALYLGLFVRSQVNCELWEKSNLR